MAGDKIVAAPPVGSAQHKAMLLRGETNGAVKAAPAKPAAKKASAKKEG